MAGPALDLARYWRTDTPDLEAVPLEPESATSLTTHTGLPFVLVREAIQELGRGDRSCCWFTWRGDACVGYISTYLDRAIRTPYGTPPSYHVGPRGRLRRAFRIWYSKVTDGRSDGLAPLPSRRLGIMTAAYLHIIEELSSWECALGSSYRARSGGAKRLWKRLEAHPSVRITRSRTRERDFAIWRGPSIGP